MVAWYRGGHKYCVTKQHPSFRSEPLSRPLSPNIAAVGTGFELKQPIRGRSLDSPSSVVR